jgi:DNA polymerase
MGLDRVIAGLLGGDAEGAEAIEIDLKEQASQTNQELQDSPRPDSGTALPLWPFPEDTQRTKKSLWHSVDLGVLSSSDENNMSGSTCKKIARGENHKNQHSLTSEIPHPSTAEAFSLPSNLSCEFAPCPRKMTGGGIDAPISTVECKLEVADGSPSLARAPVLHLDFELRSSLALGSVSLQRYATDASTEILCARYALDDGPVALWTPGMPLPDAIAAHKGFVVAHNAAFEHAIIEHLLAPRFGWPAIPIGRFVCTMAMARAAALPGSLEGAAEALGIDARKDMAGAKLMKAIATYKKAHPTTEELERLYDYCKQDVAVERELFHRLPQMTEIERGLWLLDQQINQRGIPIDRELAAAIADLAQKQRLTINADVAVLTGGKIATAGQRDKILAHLAANGCELKGLTKAAVKKALEGNINDDARKLLELRAVGSLAAPAKVKTLMAGLDDDERLRGTLVFHGAATGRWSGRKFQPQNLRKPSKTLDPEAAIAAIKSGDLGAVEALGAPLSVAGFVSRGLICARPGHVLIGADLSAIESRVLAWLASEKWKVANYAEYDRTGDPRLEPYCVMASKFLGREVTPEDEDGRAVGKVGDLACGFGGGEGAIERFAPGKFTLEERENIKRQFRAAHPRSVAFWYDLERALKCAIGYPDKIIQCGRISAECRDDTLWMMLPSGRAIAYPQARIVPGKFEGTTAICFKDNAKGKWRDSTAWYGVFVENCVQATARDILAAALVRLEAAGFPVVCHVHDEAISEILAGEDRRAEFLEILISRPPWADGLPIAGKPWCGARFLKSA